MGPAAGLTPLPPSFYARPVLEVARDLLGALVVSGEVVIRLSEVEAYGGADDPASHAFRGPTRRNSAMFGPSGVLYVYFTYGMHHCVNVVTGEGDGLAAAVLLRGGEVVHGLALAGARRPSVAFRDLARGPARLAKTLGLDLSHTGTVVTASDSLVWLAGGKPVPAGSVATGPRIGIRSATDRPWRLWVTDDPTVSKFRAAKVIDRRATDG